MALKLIIVSDIHCNSKFAPWPEHFQLKEGDTHELNSWQKWLLNNWKDFIKKTPKGFLLVLNGDLVQGIHATKDIDTITSNALDMRRACVQLLEPLVDKAKTTYVIRGTPWHGGVGEQDTEAIAETLGAVQDKETGQYSQWELWKQVEGLLFHFAHFISAAPVYPLTPMLREMMNAKMMAVDAGYPMPDCVVRSHRHIFKAVPDGKRWIFVTPGFQLRTEYIFQRNVMSLPSIGALEITVNKKELAYKPILYPLPGPTVR